MKRIGIKAGQVWEAKRVTRGWENHRRTVRVAYVLVVNGGEHVRVALSPLSLFGRASDITPERLAKDYVLVRGKRRRELLRRAA